MCGRWRSSSILSCCKHWLPIKAYASPRRLVSVKAHYMSYLSGRSASLRRSLDPRRPPLRNFPDPITKKSPSEMLSFDGLLYCVQRLLNGRGGKEMLIRVWVARWAEWQRNLPLGVVIGDNPKQTVEMMHNRVAVRALLLFWALSL
jgi:hypothetical protein